MRLHDAIFVTTCLLGAGSLVWIYVAAMEREAAKIAVPWEETPEQYAADREVVDRALRRVRDRPDNDAPDVLVIALDGVRAEALDLEDPEGAMMPRLSAWARSARVWTRASASAPWPLPSRASLLTGLPTTAHGLHRTKTGRTGRIRWSHDTLPQRFEDEGYVTFGVSAERAQAARKHALHRGFTAFVDTALTPGDPALPYTRGDRITHAATRMAEAADDGPLFLWVNYSDAMNPWVPWEPWVDDPLSLSDSVIWWPGTPKSGWFKKRKQVLGQDPDRPATENQLLTWRTVWQAELRLLDQEIGALMDAMAERDGWVVVVGTCGVELGERDLLSGGLGVYQEGVAVPLAISGPGFAPGLAPEAVDSADVPNLLLEAAGLEPLSPPDGLAVSESWFATTAELSATYGERFQQIRRAFRDGDHVLILNTGGPTEAWDLAADPAQSAPLDDAPWIAPMRERAGDWLERAKAYRPTSNDTIVKTPTSQPPIQPEAP